MSQSTIHRDLLPIIFAYGGISHRWTFSAINHLSRKICDEYHYIVSLGKDDIAKLFMFGCHCARLDLVELCLKNSVASPCGRRTYALRGLELAVFMGNVPIAKRLLEDELSPSRAKYLGDELLVGSCTRGHYEMAKLLLVDTRFNPRAYANRAIRYASRDGYIEIVRLLLDDGRANPGARYDDCIQYASRSGNVELARLLLANQRVDPSNYDNLAIIDASKYGHLEMVKLLLSDLRVNPGIFENQPLRMALRNNHLEVAKYLISDPRVANGVLFEQFSLAEFESYKKLHLKK